MSNVPTHYILVPCPLCGSVDLSLVAFGCPAPKSVISCKDCDITLARSGNTATFAVLAVVDSWNRMRPRTDDKTGFRVQVKSNDNDSPCGGCSSQGWVEGYSDARRGVEISPFALAASVYVDGYKSYMMYAKGKQ